MFSILLKTGIFTIIRNAKSNCCLLSVNIKTARKKNWLCFSVSLTSFLDCYGSVFGLVCVEFSRLSAKLTIFIFFILMFGVSSASQKYVLLFLFAFMLELQHHLFKCQKLEGTGFSTKSNWMKTYTWYKVKNKSLKDFQNLSSFNLIALLVLSVSCHLFLLLQCILVYQWTIKIRFKIGSPCSLRVFFLFYIYHMSYSTCRDLEFNFRL